MSVRAGTTLAELLVAACAGSVLLMAAASLVIAHERVARAARVRILAADAQRTPALLMREELRNLVPVDVRAVAAESVATRLFRGFALVCSSGGSDHAFEYAGIREPDPEKDSVILIDANGNERVRALRAATPIAHRSCDERAALRLDVGEDDDTTAVAALVFESGAYYLSAQALRFRRGAEGRQPLTADQLDTRASAFAPLRAQPAADVSTGVAVTVRLRDARVRAAHTRVTFLNAHAAAP